MKKIFSDDFDPSNSLVKTDYKHIDLETLSNVSNIICKKLLRRNKAFKSVSEVCVSNETKTISLKYNNLQISCETFNHFANDFVNNVFLTDCLDTKVCNFKAECLTNSKNIIMYEVTYDIYNGKLKEMEHIHVGNVIVFWEPNVINFTFDKGVLLFCNF